jgi:hypothetical protein
VSAGRFEWEARTFECIDATSGCAGVVKACLSKWEWSVSERAGAVFARGSAASSSAAKGAARKALAAHLAKAPSVQPATLTTEQRDALAGLARGRQYVRGSTGTALVKRGLAERVGAHHVITAAGREALS